MATCTASGDRQTSLELWEQVRAALLNAIVARTAKPATVTTLTYTRQMDPRTRRVTQLQWNISRGVTQSPFIAARPAAHFARDGYASGDGADQIFYAPDADVLFDDSFKRHLSTVKLRTETADFSQQRAPDQGQVADVVAGQKIIRRPIGLENRRVDPLVRQFVFIGINDVVPFAKFVAHHIECGRMKQVVVIEKSDILAARQIEGVIVCCADTSGAGTADSHASA